MVLGNEAMHLQLDLARLDDVQRKPLLGNALYRAAKVVKILTSDGAKQPFRPPV